MSKFVKSSIWNFGANFFIRLLSIVTYPFLAKYFQKGDIALFKSLQSFLLILLTLIPVGTNILFISTARSEREERWNTLIFISIISSVCIAILLLVNDTITNFFLKDGLSDVFRLFIVLFPLLEAFKVLFLTKFTSEMDFKEISLSLIIKQSFLYITIIIASFIAPSFFILLFAIFASELLELMLLASFMKKSHLSIMMHRDKPLFFFDKTAKKYIFFYGSDQIFNTLALQFPTIFLVIVLGKNLAPELQLPIYAVSVPATMVMVSISKVVFPYMSELRENEKIRNTLSSIIFIVTFIIFPILVFISYFSNEIVSILFRKDWSNAVFALTLLPLLTVSNILSSPFSTIPAIKGKPHISLIYSFFLLVVRLSSIYFGFKFFGFNGTVLFYIIGDFIIRVIRLSVDMHLIKMKLQQFLGSFHLNAIFSILLLINSFLLNHIINNKIIAFLICFLSFIALNIVFQKQRLCYFWKHLIMSFKQ